MPSVAASCAITVPLASVMIRPLTTENVSEPQQIPAVIKHASPRTACRNDELEKRFVY